MMEWLCRSLLLATLCLSRVWGFVAPAISRPAAVVLAPTSETIANNRRLLRPWRLNLSAEDDDEDEEDEGDGPLSRGIDSVSWLPTLIGARDVENPRITHDDAEFLPLFPLGGIVYTPNSQHVLNIFEPRYRQMYSDILMNGTKRFVVSMSHPTESGRFAKMGVLFELEDLKEVSEQTGDKIKYICNHKVTGRVQLHRVLNPTSWETRDTYLRVEGTIIDDSGKEIEKNVEAKKEESSVASSNVYGAVADAASDAAILRLEKQLRGAFSDLVDVQHDMEEDVRFTRASVATLAVKDGAGANGLWSTIKLWQTFADQRLMARQNELQQEFQERLQAFLKKDRGLKEDELPSAIGFNELSRDLQEEVKELQKRMAVELQPLVLESTLTMQKILEAEDHPARLKLLRCFIEAETQRLNTKRTLKGMFSSSTATSSEAAASPPSNKPVTSEDRGKEPDKPKDAPSSSQPSSLFIDEEDAFQ